MFKNFKEIERTVLRHDAQIRIAVAGSHDDHVLDAVVKACENKVAQAILIGDCEKTKKLLADMDCSHPFEFIEASGDAAIADCACDLVKNNRADIPMKGIIRTAAFMKEILNKEHGFIADKALVSQATLFEWKDRFMILTDCAINIAPTYEELIKIINNAVALGQKVGIATPKVAVLAPVEAVNPKIESTIHAAMLTVANRRGQIKGCLIDGPLALDNAVSYEAARRKGIAGDVAGMADILVVPDLNAGNIFTKSLTLFAGLKTAGTVNGTKIPVIMCSRTDSPEDKYHSVLAALMQFVA